MASDERAALLVWDGPPDTARYALLRTHPNFPAWVQSFARAMLEAGDNDPLLDGILKDAGRNAAAMLTAHLHFSGGISLPQLKTLCVSLGLVSRGRARALLLYMRYLGYVRPTTDRPSGPATIYVATPKFLKTWCAMQTKILESLDIIVPAARLGQHHPFSVEQIARFTCFLSEGFLSTAPQIDRNAPYFRVFMHSHAGIQIVHSLLAASADGFPPQAPIALSLARTAARFRVSRVHVRRVLAAGERNGLLRLCEGSGVAFEPEGRAALDFIFSTQLLQFLRAAAQTFRNQPRDDTAFPMQAHERAENAAGL